MKKTVCIMCCLWLFIFGMVLTSCTDICDHVYAEMEEERIFPTCTKDGVYVYACTLCGKKTTVLPQPTDTAMKALGHDRDEGRITGAPSCLSEGTAVYTCQTCDEVLETVTLPAKGHVCDSAQIQSDGSTHWYVCETCGGHAEESACEYIFVPQDATWHKEACRVCLYEKVGFRGEHHMDGGVITTEPTCFSPGCKTYTCVDCTYTEQETLPIVGHDYDEVHLCANASCHWVACRFCKEVQEGTAAPHVYEAAVEHPPTASSCTPGYIAEACTLCSYVKTTPIPSSLPHTLTMTLNDRTPVYTCRQCAFSWTSILTSVSDGTDASHLHSDYGADICWGSGNPYPDMVDGYYKYERNAQDPTKGCQAQFCAQLPGVVGDQPLPSSWTGAHISLKLKQGEAYMENWQIMLSNTCGQKADGTKNIPLLSVQNASAGVQNKNLCDAMGRVLAPFSIGLDWVQIDMELTFDKDADTIALVYYVNGKYSAKVQLENRLLHNVFDSIYFASPAGDANVYSAESDSQPSLYFDDIILAIRGED